MKYLLRLSSCLAALTVAGVFLLPGNYALASTEAQLLSNQGMLCEDGAHADTEDFPYVAQKITVSNRTLTSWSQKFIRAGTPTGNLYFRIWDYGENGEIGNLVYSQLWLDVSTIATSATVYTITLDSPIWLNGDYRIGTYSSSQSGLAHTINTMYQSTDVKASEYIQRWHSESSEWEGTDAWGDLYYSYEYTSGGGAPQVITQQAYGTSVAGEMSLRGLVNTIGSGEVTLTGVQWGTSTGNYTGSANASSSITDNNTSFAHTATSLINGTTYYWRALAQNAAGLNYGQEETFTMGDTPTLHITRAWMNANETTLHGTAYIDSDGGGTITSAGIYFSTTAGGVDFNTIPATLPEEGEEYETEATGSGVLDTRYYARAYAVTSQGIAYSIEVTFIAGRSEYVYNDSGTGVDIILPITTALNNTLESVGMDNGPGRTLAAFIVIAAAWFFFRDKKPLNIIMPVVAFAAMFAIGWIEIWLIIVGAALIGVILYFTAGRRASSNA